jgi:SAM-dependent methyltransferase
VGDLYPEAEVTGIDLSPIQPSWVPPNVRFLVDDVEAEWTYRPASLDYIHARHVCMAIKDWPKLIRQSYDALKPGGWIELQEIKFTVLCDDDTLPADYGYARYTDAVHAGFARFGVFTNKVAQNPELVREGGFQNVEERVWKLPIGAWPRDQKMKAVGIFCRQMLVDALQGLAMAALTRGLGWTPQQVEVFLVDVRKSLLDVSVHSYLTFHIVTGQKPGGAVTA